MREALLEILASPCCRADVRLSAVGEQDDPHCIRTGILTCNACGSRYPVTAGVPRLLRESAVSAAGPLDVERRTGRHFATEFTALADGDRDLDPPEVVEYYFYTRTGLDPGIFDRLPDDFYRTSVPGGAQAYLPDRSFLEGKRVLDAGCGPGRFTPVAAAGAKQVVGLDLGDHVDRAALRCRRLPNVEFVQGSVLDPPFRRGVFDYVFSVGVLHHTPDPKGACRQLAELLTPAGAMSIWVYPPGYWGGRVRAVVNRSVHSALSHLPPGHALGVCTHWLYPLGRLQTGLARRHWSKLAAAPLFLLSVPRHPRREVMIATIYDYFCPPIISTHSYEEVRAWLTDAGFRHLRKLPVPTGWFAERQAAASNSRPTCSSARGPRDAAADASGGPGRL